MSQSLPTPLVPLPRGLEGTVEGHKDDLFATLFSPPTPRASPVTTPCSVETSVARPSFCHSRGGSADSDFGSFISVPATEDPLHASHEHSPTTPFSPIQNIEFFDRFTEDAKAATEKSKQGVLSELLEHEDDPLYFLQSSTGEDVSRSTTPVPSSTHPDPPTAETPQQEQLLVDLSPRATDPDDRHSRHIMRQQRRSEFSRARSRSPPLRSPSLPPSTPVRISKPEIQPAQSSFFTPASLPSHWMSSFLSSAIRPTLSRTRTITEEPAPDKSDDDMSHHTLAHQSTLPARLPSQLLESLNSRSHQPVTTASQAVQGIHTASTMPVDAAITHGSPFSSHPFVPATGAPGFAGDREWDKGFEFDKADVETKSVRLVGRKEVTAPVLTVEVADMIRPHFPALARLPRSWSLLYSLDQHGISLKTLYTRCQNHIGSALVVMRDSGGTLFGAWMGQGIHQSKGSYYGSGESFLWKIASDKRLRVYKWTGKNDYVALCEPEYLSFGGGDGHYGLYLDDSLIDGSSARCPTFDNEPLCSAGPRQGENVRFECVGLEVWGVG